MPLSQINNLKHQKSIKIGIDASRLAMTSTKTGVEVVTKHIVDGLLNLIETSSLDHEISKYQIQNKEYQKNTQSQIFNIQLTLYAPHLINDLPTNKQKILRWPPKYLWSQIRLAWELVFHPPDALYVPTHVIPFLYLICPWKKKIVTNMHDIAFLKDKKSYSLKSRYYLTLADWLTIKLADSIIVPTQVVKNNLIKYFRCPKEKITVILWGYESTKQQDNKTIKQQDKKPQILYIGRVEEKKNIRNLIEAFKFFIKKHPEYKLVLAGKPGHGFDKIQSEICNLKSEISNLGYVSDEQKYQLLNESSCLVLISKDEGFGIPLLEGFDCNIPVLASNIPVLKETGENACLYTNPNDPQQISKDLEKIIFDDKLRQGLIQKGQQRLKHFNWTKTVQQIMQEIYGYL